MTAGEPHRPRRRPKPVLRRRDAAALLALVVVLGACGGDDEPVATDAGATSTTTAAAPADGELAIVRCDDVPSLSGEPVVDGPISPDEDVAAAQQERAGYGVPSDEASTVAAIADGPSPELGFALTAEEEADFIAAQETTSATAQALQERYASDPGYAGTWLDNARRVGVLATTDDVAALQAEVDADLGPGAALVVAAERTEAELAALQSAVTAWIEDHLDRSGGSGQRTDRGVVSVFLDVLDPALVADLAATVGPDGLCVEGADPADVIPEGPQPQSGAGWRLLADAPGVGAAYDTGFAGSPGELAALWTEIGLDGDPPAIDFSQEVVVWFGPAVSGSCDDVRMDDVVLDGDVLRPEIVLPGGARACTDDANPHAYVIAYERARLPERFTVTVAPNDTCCPEATTEVELGFNG